MHLLVDKFFKCFYELGFSNEEIINMTKILPDLFIFNDAELRRDFDIINKDYGFSKKTISQFPQFLFMQYTLLDKGLILRSLLLGVSIEQIISIVDENPQILFCSNKDIVEKISFYKFVGLEEIFIKNPKCVSQDVELTFARYMFYFYMDVMIDMDNFELLFEKQEDFMNKYNISDKQLLEKYPYPYAQFRESVRKVFRK